MNQEPVIQAVRDDQISLGQASAFTISTDERLSLEVLARVRGTAVSDWQIKRWLKPDSVRGSDRRAIYVGREAYLAAGGRLEGEPPPTAGYAIEARLNAEDPGRETFYAALPDNAVRIRLLSRTNSSS